MKTAKLPVKKLAQAKTASTKVADQTPAQSDPLLPTIKLPNISCASYAPLFEQYSWNVHTAVAICQAESQGNPNAISPTNDYGLMQINNGLALYGTAIYDPAFNIKIAYTVKYLNSGWLPWTTFTSQRYLKYL